MSRATLDAGAGYSEEANVGRSLASVLVSPPAIIGVLAVAVLVGALTTDGFFTSSNATAVLSAMAVTGILAVGTTLIMISGNFFSLSLGITLTSSSMVFLASLKFGLLPAIALSIALGAAVGAVQGLIVGALRANAIIVTLGFGALAQGVVIWLTGGHSVVPSSGTTSYLWIVNNKVLGIPVETVIFLVLAAAVQAALVWTRFGRGLYLVGASRAAALASGVRVTRVVVTAFALAGLCAGLAGLLVGAGSRQANLGFTSTYDFDAITAVLVGGTAIAGGRGSIKRTLFGVGLLAVMSDLLVLRGANLQTQIFIKGLIVVLVVAVTASFEMKGQK